MEDTRAILNDIIHHVGFLGTAKITGTVEGVAIESMDEVGRTVILKGKLNGLHESFMGEFGMQNLEILQGLLNFTNFKTEDSTIEFKRSDQKDSEGNTVSCPSEIVFTDDQKQVSRFRLISSAYVPNQAKFRGVDKWDVSITPSKSKILEFTHLSDIFKKFETHFEARTEDGNLIFSIGGASVSGGFLIFANDVEGELPAGLLSWPTSQILHILNRTDDPSKTQMNFSTKGALQITVESPLATYDTRCHHGKSKYLSNTRRTSPPVIE